MTKMEKFTKEDRNLIQHIEIDIKKNPYNYRDAGNWLDEQFYDEASFWQKAEKLAEIFEAEHKDRGFSELSPEEWDELRFYEKLFKYKKIPTKALRILQAMESFFDEYHKTYFFDLQSAKAICLITWLLSDPDAQKMRLGLTQFEGWGWEEKEPLYPDGLYNYTITRGGVLREFYFNHHPLHSRAYRGLKKKEQLQFIKKMDCRNKWMEVVHAAWAKVEAEKEVEKASQAEKELKEQIERQDRQYILAKEQIQNEKAKIIIKSIKRQKQQLAAKKLTATNRTTDNSGEKQDTPQIKLSLTNEKAYQSFEVAINKEPKLADKTDKQVFDWLKENNDSIEDYELPCLATWQRYVRAGRKHYGTSKNTIRAGRTLKSAISITDPAINQITSKVENKNKTD